VRSAKGSNLYLAARSGATSGSRLVVTDSPGSALAFTFAQTNFQLYQNPQPYLQLQYTQIPYAGSRGDTITIGMSGNRVVAARNKLGLPVSQYCPVDNAMANSVASFQHSRGLPATGEINLSTWTALGLNAESFTSMDNGTHALRVNGGMERGQIIEQFIATAYDYRGQPYVGGGSPPTPGGVDCSGLTMQCLYSVGINPLPQNSWRHAHSVAYRYESRGLWENGQILKVSYAQRQRGDLIFYNNGYGDPVNHVAIYLGNNQIIHAWPSRGVVVEGISSGGSVVGVGRPFI
jgi:cell wall-associated NlpC family hydrolase